MKRLHIKAVIDTNIFVSGTISKKGKSALLIDCWKDGKFNLVISKVIIDEIIEVLNRPEIKVRCNYTKREIDELIELIWTLGIVTPGLYEVKKSKDPKDDMFLACALEGKTDYLITGDTHLINLKYYHGVQIVNVVLCDILFYGYKQIFIQNHEIYPHTKTQST
ncbi:MAG: putative toxin-antitoxin system toxin component, PIN family [bacterium]|nr:putative toxin-antitoxin system toxin component, PIN family [bacterium]